MRLFRYVIARRCAVLLRTVPVLSALFVGCVTFSGCGDFFRQSEGTLLVFHAAGFTPVIDAVSAPALLDIGVRLRPESSGSQVASRKVEELDRQCDLLILADNRLVGELLPTTCSWRLDFATDELVLAVGTRAPHVDEAEKDWIGALLRDDVRFGRVDENQGPIGYRSIITLKLEEKRRNLPGVASAVLRRSAVIADDINRLAPLLKNGDLDYALAYRSICLAMDMRFIELDPEVNLGNADMDYSGANVTFEKLGAGQARQVSFEGAPAVWTLTVPDQDSDLDTALRFVKYLLVEKNGILIQNGFSPMNKPVFYGPMDVFPFFEGWSVYGGALQ